MNHASLRFALCGFALLSCSSTPCENPTTDTLGELTAWEREYIAGPPASPPPPAFLPAEDGLALAYHEWIPETWDGTGAVVLMVPGSSAYAELYTPLGEGLAARGVFTRIIDVRGHGRSTCDANGTCGRPPTGGYASDDDGRYWVGRPGDSRDENQIGLGNSSTIHTPTASLREALSHPITAAGFQLAGASCFPSKSWVRSFAVSSSTDSNACAINFYL